MDTRANWEVSSHQRGNIREYKPDKTWSFQEAIVLLVAGANCQLGPFGVTWSGGPLPHISSPGRKLA